MSSTYQLGQTIYWSLRVTSDGTTSADLGGGNPTATVTLPNGTTAAALVTKTSTGNYTAALLSTQVGRHPITWTGSGANSSGLPYTDSEVLVQAGSALAITVRDLAEHLRTTIAEADLPAATAICAAASAVVRARCNATLLAAATDDQLEVARLVMTRVAGRMFNNPNDRTAYSGPEGLAFSPIATSVRVLTDDEREQLAPLTLPLGFA